jgi:heterodisulfide reductase subunit C
LFLLALVIRVKYDADDNLTLVEASEICLKCGVCCVIKEHSCHAQLDSQFNPKYTYVYDCLGTDSPSENPNIWLCVSCHKCEELCPYEVSPIRFIEAMKAKALEDGLAHPVIFGEVDNVVSTGFAFPLTASSRRQRRQMDLELLDESAAEDLRKIAEKTGLSEKIAKHRGKKH